MACIRGRLLKTLMRKSRLGKRDVGHPLKSIYPHHAAFFLPFFFNSSIVNSDLRGLIHLQRKAANSMENKSTNFIKWISLVDKPAAESREKIDKRNEPYEMRLTIQVTGSHDSQWVVE